MWIYHRPGHEHRNVVPYHPKALLMWRAHINLQVSPAQRNRMLPCYSTTACKSSLRPLPSQRIFNHSLNYYICKYALKMEVTGPLRFDHDAAVALGFDDLSKAHMDLISSMVQTMPVSATDAALHLLDIDLVTTDCKFRYMDSSPRDLRKHFVNTFGRTAVHPVDLYCRRPEALEHLTFVEYFTAYRVVKSGKDMKTFTLAGEDLDGNKVSKEKDGWLVRFTDFNPHFQSEAFFYNVLLRHVAFRQENDLITALENENGTFFTECRVRGVINNVEDLQEAIEGYTRFHLYRREGLHEVLQKVLNENSLDESFDPSSPGIGNFDDDIGTVEDAYNAAGPLAPPPQPMEVDADFTLTEEQQAVFDVVQTPGMHAILGGPGAGKSFLIDALTRSFRAAGKVVAVAATTGAAATRLGAGAKTVHKTFNIGVGNLYTSQLPTDHPVLKQLKATDVFIIDEISMMNRPMLSEVVDRIRLVSACRGC
jgi:hypothetical protein